MNVFGRYQPELLLTTCEIFKSFKKKQNHDKT